MSRLWARFTALFSSRTVSRMDKSGNRYYARNEEIDGFMNEKRWVEFKGEHDPTSIPVEWICWLNGQRKRAPTPEEMTELEARRERVRLSVALLKKEEEERKAKGKATSIGKVAGPDLKSFIRQFPSDSQDIKTGNEIEEAPDSPDVPNDKDPKQYQSEKDDPSYIREEPLCSRRSLQLIAALASLHFTLHVSKLSINSCMQLIASIHVLRDFWLACALRRLQYGAVAPACAGIPDVGLQSRQELVNLSDLGHGNHEWDAATILKSISSHLVL